MSSLKLTFYVVILRKSDSTRVRGNASKFVHFRKKKKSFLDKKKTFV